MLTEINGYWQDETCNTWSTKDYTKANAEAAAASLTDCCFCRNCANCTDCENCTECTDCKECKHCEACDNLQSGVFCRDCHKSNYVMFSDNVRNSNAVVYSSQVRNAAKVNHGYMVVSDDTAVPVTPLVTINNIPIPGLPLQSINITHKHGVQIIEHVDYATHVSVLEPHIQELGDSEPDAVKYAARRNYDIIALRLRDAIMQLIEAYRPKEEHQ